MTITSILILDERDNLFKLKSSYNSVDDSLNTFEKMNITFVKF